MGVFKIKRVGPFFFICLLVVGSCSPLHTVVSNGQGLIRDPAVLQGSLANGFQYLVLENRLPEKKVSLYLNVFAGSVHETDYQQGIAHFLEHMQFNGSRQFEPGELIAHFQSIGMDFGADINAQTGFYHTTYQLSLPDNIPTHLDKALSVFQDYAWGASLSEKEIDRERGIILAEKRERDSVTYRLFKQKLAFELPGARLTRRFPIGSASVIEKADRALLKSYYDRWYRPDNMILIAVGDVDARSVEDLIRRKFSKWLPRTLLAEDMGSDGWKPHPTTKGFYQYEPESADTRISIETLSWKPADPETPDELKLKALNRLAHRMLENRLSGMINRQVCHFTRAEVFSGRFLGHVEGSSVTVTCNPGQWAESLREVETELRRAIVFGFFQNELDRACSDFLASLDLAVQQAGSQTSRELADRILEAVQEKNLLLSAAQRKELLEPFIKSVSLRDIRLALADCWPEDPRLIPVTGNLKLDEENPENLILEVYHQSKSRPVSVWIEPESAPFPYLTPPGPLGSKIDERQDNIGNLGITAVDFDNHVRLNIRPSTYKKNEILFKAWFGDGRHSEPVSKPGLAMLSEMTLAGSGLGRLNADQMDEALAGKKLQLGFDVEENHFSLSGFTDSRDLELLFQCLYHYFQDPGIRTQALSLSKKQYEQMYEKLMRTPQGIMQIKGRRFLAGDDPRFGMPDPSVIRGYSLKDVQEWVLPQFMSGPLELSVAGDFDPEQLIEMASRYLGALERRNPPPSPETAMLPGIRFPENEILRLRVDTRLEKAMINVAFLTDDFWDIARTRRLSVLSRVISERLRLEIREALGETYSPYVYNDPSLIFDRYGVLHLVLNVHPEKKDVIVQKVRDIVEHLSLTPITEKELETALKPVLHHLEEYVQTNEYWLNSVMAGSFQYPRKLDWAGGLLTDYKAVKRQELFDLAEKYLKWDRCALILIESGPNAP